MSGRQLKRVKGISKEDVEKLNEQKILNCKDVLCKNVLELMNINNSYKNSQQLMKIVSRIVAPNPRTALEMSQKKKQTFLSTSLPSLDNALHGGLSSGTITEVTGPPGCGKTQFCMMLSSLTVLDQVKHHQRGTVVYIDTENAFTGKRFLEITCKKLQQLDYGDVMETNVLDEIMVTTALERVLVFLESSIESLIERLQGLEEIIIKNDVKLIIVDSIASLIRKEFGHQALLVDRNNLLMKEATLLKYYAESFNLHVFVTNQITTAFNPEFSQESSLIAALGNTWAHAVNTRMMVRFFTGDLRELFITKSPLCALTKARFKVTCEGIVEVGDDEEE